MAAVVGVTTGWHVVDEHGHSSTFLLVPKRDENAVDLLRDQPFGGHGSGNIGRNGLDPFFWHKFVKMG
jgi:hypothetical protein